MKKYSRIIALLLAVVLVLPGAGLVTQAKTNTATPHVERLGGAGRVETSVLVSKEVYPTTADVVILAGYNGGVDALTATSIAAKMGAPVLFTEQGKLTAATQAEIVGLGAKTVHILGGEKAVSKEVFTAVDALTGVTANRVEGKDRYETAAAVAKVLASTTKHAFVALGTEVKGMFPDALAVGPAAAKLNSPILLTQAGKLPVATKAALAGIEKVTVVGGNQAITPAVVTELTGMGIVVDRVEGSNREATALQIANKYFAGSNKAVLANGYMGADALIGGYYAHALNAPILLVQTAKVDAAVQAYITANVTMAHILGGNTVVSAAVETAVNLTIQNAELSVVSLNALNTKQIEVKFNRVVDKATAETASNYTVAGVAYGKAVLSEDGMTVVATMAGETKVVNATEVEFKVLKNIKDAEGNALKADFVKKITVIDNVSPTFVSVEAIGLKTLLVKFSEPIMDNGTDTTLETDLITVKSGIYNYVVTSSEADYAAGTVKLTLGTNIIEGPITLKINAMGMSDANALRDFAGLIIVPSEHVYSYAKDTSVAVATLASVNKDTKVAKVVFSKPVFGANVKLYHSVSGSAAYGTAAVTKVEGTASTEWEFTFTNDLPSGQLNFFLINDTVVVNQLTDLFGVKVPNQTFTKEVIADVTAPTVSKLTVNTNSSIDVKFSEAINANEQVRTSNFEILKPDGTALAFTVSANGLDTSRLTATLVDNTTYTVNVKAMKDLAGNVMSSVYSSTVTVKDNKHPDLDKAYFTNDKTVYLVFTEEMNKNDLADKNNYLSKGNALGANDKVEVVSGTKVKISFENTTSWNGTEAVSVGPVRDLAGKKLTSETTFLTPKAVVADILTYTAELIELNKIKIKFDNELSAFDNTDFTISIPTATILSIESNVVVKGKTEVVLVLDRDIAANAVPTVTAGSGLNTKSIEGTKVKAGAVVAIDKVAPTIKKVVFVNANLIELQMTEGLLGTSFAVVGTNGFSVTGGTLTSAKPGATEDVVLLVGTGFTANTDVTYVAGNIVDKATTPVAMASVTKSETMTLGAITVVNAAPDNTFTVTTNFEAPVIVIGDVDMDSSAGVQDSVIINGITYTATEAGGTVTIAATGTAAAVSTATSATFTVTLNGVSKTVEMNIPAYALSGAAAPVTIAGQ